MINRRLSSAVAIIRIKDRGGYKITSLQDEVPRCYFRMLFCPGEGGEGT